jgi:hypothetical protein
MPQTNDSPCAAVAAVLATARWEAHDLLTRRSPESANELLIAHAAELALSPDARDQLLSVALSEAAFSVATGRAVLLNPPTVFVDYDSTSETARHTIRDKVFHYATDHWQAGLDDAAIFTRTLSMDAIPMNGFAHSTTLTEAAVNLQRYLWDHPKTPAETHIRLVMFLSLPMLETRLLCYRGVNKSEHQIIDWRKPTTLLRKIFARKLHNPFEA